MHADCAFYTGLTHLVCEDYARVGMKGGLPYAMLSDGCSTSPDTDTGARLLVLAAERAMDYRDNGFGNVYAEQAISTADATANSLKLSPDCLDATLLYAILHPSIKPLVNEEQPYPLSMTLNIFGDGAFSAKHRDGTIHIGWVHYTLGYPDYLNYQIRPSRNAAWIAKQNEYLQERSTGDTYLPFEAGGDEEVIQLRLLTISPSGKVKFFDNYRPDMESDHFVFRGPYPHKVGINPYDMEWVAIMSDGVESFIETSEKPSTRRILEAGEVIQEMLAFKNFKGQFVKRRMNSFLRSSAKQGWTHDDDISVAAIYLGDLEL